MLTLSLFLLACGGDDARSKRTDLDDAIQDLVAQPWVLQLDPERRFLAVPASEVPLVAEVMIDGVDRLDVGLRVETSSGDLIGDDVGPVLALVEDQRLIIEIDDERWCVAITPDDLPPLSGPGGEVDGFFFLTPRDFTSQYPPSDYGRFLMIVDGWGTPVWWRRATGLSNDFRVGGDGMFSAQTFLDGAPARESVRVDPRTGLVLERWLPEQPEGWEGAWTDPHELTIGADGSAMTVITGAGYEDLSPVGGSTSGEVQHSAVQELDADRNVTAEWIAELVDMTTLPPEAIATESQGAAWRWTHINSAESLEDGWLLSLRTPNEVVKVLRETSEVAWRLGGAHSDFTFTNDGGFYGQHSARWLGDDRVILFDNRTNFGSPPLGDVRYVEYQLDMDAMTATLVDSYELEGAGGADYTGHVQRLSDGRTVVGWGSTQTLDDGSRAPSIHVLEPDGTVALELSLPLGTYSYRSWYHTGDPISGVWDPQLP